MNETQQNILYGTGCVYELTKWIVILIVFFCLLHFFVATIFIVDGISMEPNFQNGELIIANRWQYNFGEPSRGDAVILKFPGDPERKKYIKRIIGLPGERIEIRNNQVLINGKLLNETYLPPALATDVISPINQKLGPDEYFIMGDNRPNSNDSRVWGTAARRFLIGKAWLSVYPNFRKIEEFSY